MGEEARVQALMVHKEESQLMEALLRESFKRVEPLDADAEERWQKLKEEQEQQEAAAEARRLDAAMGGKKRRKKKKKPSATGAGGNGKGNDSESESESESEEAAKRQFGLVRGIAAVRPRPKGNTTSGTGPAVENDN